MIPSTPCLFRGRQLRFAQINGQLWFSAPDAAKCLGRKKTGATFKVVAPLAPEDRRLVRRSDDLPGLFGDTGPATMTVININGLLALARRTRSPIGKQFTKWVTQMLLPNIAGADGHEAPQGFPAVSYTHSNANLPLALAKAFRRAASALEGSRIDVVGAEHLTRVLSAALSGFPTSEVPEGPQTPVACPGPSEESHSALPVTQSPSNLHQN